MSRIISKLSALLAVILITINSANAAIEIPDAMKQTMAQEVSGMPSLLNLVVSMILVIAMIYLTGWIYNKLNIVNKNKLKSLSNNDTDLKKFTVIQSMPLGQQRYIYTVEMAGKILLVGSTPSHINLLKEFSENDFVVQNTISNQKTDVSNEKENSVNIDELYKKYKL